MNIEEASIEFLEKQIDTNFQTLCSHFLIEDVVWLEDDIELRPYALMSDYNTNKEINLYILFPPLNKNSINN
tara:strand:- start:12 stop:227 length:216 start_codon:yes stop_codon:yes gene_type:complete